MQFIKIVENNSLLLQNRIKWKIYTKESDFLFFTWRVSLQEIELAERKTKRENEDNAKLARGILKVLEVAGIDCYI